MATELAKAYVQILPSTKGIKSNLESELSAAGDSAGQKTGSAIGSSIKSVILAAGIGVAIKTAISQGAELEQNLGGTMAVFGEFAKTVETKAVDAYKNMGLSASDYMSTANKMGSLFQGSGLTQQRSLDLTTEAMQRAADVASVMGIDMEWAMESIAGAAKGNFTMMDNLGVAMNATTLEAYAMEQGMDNFSYSTATNAEKAELAMKMFLDRTSQYAGNFARESEETLSGSMGAVKAAWQNTLANLTLGNDIQPSLTALVETVKACVVNNLLPALVNIVSTAPGMLITLFAALAPELLTSLYSAIQGVLLGLSAQMPTLLSELSTGMFAAIATIFTAAPELLAAGLSFIESLITGIMTALPALLEAMPKIITDMSTKLSSGYGEVLEAGNSLLESLIEAVSVLIPKLISALPAVIVSIVTFLCNNFAKILDAAVQMLTAIIEAIPKIVAKLVPQLPTIIAAIIKALISAIPQIGAAALKALGAIVSAIPKILGSVASAAANIGLNLIKGLINGISNATSWLYGMLSGWVSSVISYIKGLFGIHSPSTVTEWFGEMLDKGLAGGILDNIKPIKKAIDSVVDVTTGTLDSGLTISASTVSAMQPATTDISKLILLLMQMIEKMAQMGVYLDGEKLVGGIIDKIDSALGSNSVLAERGVI